MSLHLKDLNLRDLLDVAAHLPPAEREVHTALRGAEFSPEDTAAELFLQRGMFWVFADERGPVAVGGVAHLRDGVVSTRFLAIERAWTEHGAALTEMVKDLIRRILDQKVAHRIETVTLANQRRARAWYGRIGLQYEATHPGYCVNGETAVTYVAVRVPENT